MTQPHPIAVIQAAKINFQYGSEKPIQSQTSPTKFINIKSDIKNRIEQFDLLTKCAISSHSLSEDDTKTVQKFKEIAKRDILYSAISPDFFSKHDDEIRHETTYDTLFSFITDVIGTQTEKMKIAAAEKQLQNATRNVTENEKWNRFYDRIKRYASDVSTQGDIQKYLITNAFKKNLTPRLKTFLLEQGKTDLDTKATAIFLDNMNKHKSDVNISQIEIEGATKQIAEVCKQNTQLQIQNEDLHDKIDSLQTQMQRMITEAVNQTKLELFKINANPKNTITDRDHPQNHSVQRSDRSHQSTNNQYPTHWELNQYGRPFTCRKCGVRGHKDENCKGLVKCYICHKTGHSKYICPNKTRQSKN